MKRSKYSIFYLSIAASLLIFFTSIFSSGCDISESSALSITKSSGMLAMTTWFAFDNPDPEVKKAVSIMIDSVLLLSKKIKPEQSYLDNIYPRIVLSVDQNKNIKEEYKPLIKSGSIVLLTGIDQLFDMNSQIKNDKDNTLKYIESFCSGAKYGLLLSGEEPQVFRASRAYSLRMKLKKN